MYFYNILLQYKNTRNDQQNKIKIDRTSFILAFFSVLTVVLKLHDDIVDDKENPYMNK